MIITRVQTDKVCTQKLEIYGRVGCARRITFFRVHKSQFSDRRMDGGRKGVIFNLRLESIKVGLINRLGSSGLFWFILLQVEDYHLYIYIVCLVIKIKL